ncbi:MAG: glycosyltransferase family 4 protein [Phycisphaerae bacterium]|nr:glycosyltransferase family 4 protein [Phycisphaerae bacterium]
MRPRLCFVSHNAYGAMCGGGCGHIGGVEWQTSLMAKWFAARGYRVGMVTWHEGQDDDEVIIDGVRVIKMCRRDQGFPGVRFFHPRWSSLMRAMRRADADVYYQNCAEYVTGQVAIWCRRHRKRFVYSVASDMDCDSRLPELRSLRERILYSYGLRHADHVVVQTRTQQAMLRTGFDRDSVVIPMPCSGPLNGDYQPPAPPISGPARILWVGRIAPVKRLELLLDVAEAMPNVTFNVVGPLEQETGYARTHQERARNLANVVFQGRVPREQMPSLYQNAACLCCTSRFEGFPNTFLEAWSHGLPVVSMFDPDDLIMERGLGAAATDVPGLIAGIRSLLASPDRWRQASDNARRYYVENHTVEAVLPRFEQLLLNCVDAGTRT